MKNLKMLKSILKIGVIAILLFSINNVVFGANSITISPTEDVVATSDGNNNTNKPTGIQLSSNNNTNRNTNNTNSNKTNTNLPKTGMEDNTMLFIVLAVCGVSAVYAYKKVADYKKL